MVLQTTMSIMYFVQYRICRCEVECKTIWRNKSSYGIAGHTGLLFMKVMAQGKKVLLFRVIFGIQGSVMPAGGETLIKVLSRLWRICIDFPCLFSGCWRVQILEGGQRRTNDFFCCPVGCSLFLSCSEPNWSMCTWWIVWLLCTAGSTAPVVDSTTPVTAEGTPSAGPFWRCSWCWSSTSNLRKWSHKH